MSVVLLSLVDNVGSSTRNHGDVDRSRRSSSSSIRSNSSKESKTKPGIRGNGSGDVSNVVVIRASANHSVELQKGLQELWKDKLLTDVTLRVGDRTFPCHRNVLASISPYFHRMFCTNMLESSAREVSLKGITAESIIAILDFAYTSKMTFSRDTVPQILEASDMLLMPLVKDACTEFMEARLDPSNCLSIFTLAERHNCGELAGRAWSFALRNFRSVRNHPEILVQPIDVITRYLSRDDLVIEEEEEVFETMIAWINDNRKARLPHLQKLMTHLREHLLPTQYLIDKVLSHPFLTKSQAVTAKATSRHRRDLTYEDRFRSRSRSRRVVLVVGGIGPANIKLTEVKYYDPVDRRWSTFSHLPFESEPVSCVTALDDDVYVMGSRGSFIVHRAEDSEWCNLPHLPRERMRQRLACSTSDGHLYFVGGFDGDQRVRMVDRFDTKENRWHELNPLPVAVSSPATAIFGDKLFVFGGALADGTPTDLVYSYDLELDGESHSTQGWKPRNTMPHAFSGITAVVLGDHIYVVGCVATVVHRYNPAADAWDQAEHLASTHALCGAAVCGGKIYVTGGENQPNSPISGVEAYDPTSNRWTPCQSLPYPIRLHGCASVIRRI